MPAGRPTKYTKELLEKARKYLSDWESLDDVIPSHIALSQYIDISTSYMYKWAKEEGKEEFSQILQDVNELQQRTLVNKGLSGDFNSNITKLVLGKHGYHEKQDRNTSGVVGMVDLTDKTDDELKAIISGKG